MFKKYITKIGNINSAVDKPIQIVLRALPLDLSKYLEMAVDEVWLIKPCPENLIKKIPKANKKILSIKEKINDDINKSAITKKE